MAGRAMRTPRDTQPSDVPELTVTGNVEPDLPQRLMRLRSLAIRGLALSYRPDHQDMVFTRRRGTGHDLQAFPAGTSLRYTAMAALGLDRVSPDEQRDVLDGLTARELATRLVDRTSSATPVAELAVVCWAAAEIGAPNAEDALMRLLAGLRATSVLPTVHAAWALTALVAARRWAYCEPIAEGVRDQLMVGRRSGAVLFGHANSGGRYVGCFADQVYPIQALARYAQVTGDEASLEASSRCAARICDLQGPAGQWWWHYDSRTDQVLEGYPVYSVHQHAMAPMALRDLHRAGGPEHAAAVERGLDWLEAPPERPVRLIDDAQAVVWRKIGRREYPRKSVRAVKATVGRVRPGLSLSLLDRVAPPLSVDWECRPYELGWLLYAWCGIGGVPDGAPSR
jgi:hypothetical protein